MSAKEAVLGGAAPAGERLLHELGEELGEHAGASVFAPPVERDGLTVIPSVPPGGVSEPDSDRKPAEGGEGVGGGGGALVAPIGYIELRDGASRFRPIVDLNLVVKTAAILIGAFLVLRRRHR